MGLLEPAKYGEYFHELFVCNYDNRKKTNVGPGSANSGLVADVKSRKKKHDKQKLLNNQHDQSLTVNVKGSSHLELDGNASKFALFCRVRGSVLEAETKHAFLQSGLMDRTNSSMSVRNQCCSLCRSLCKMEAVSFNRYCRCHQMGKIYMGLGQNISRGCGTENDSDADSYTDETTGKYVVVQLPQMVGAGLRGLFELIAEARFISPALCTKALKSLFDVVQGQHPESFKSEPIDLIYPLYDLLLDLATHNTNELTTDTNWSSIGCATLLSLCVARGDTGKTLKAISVLIMSPKSLADQVINFPTVLLSLQRSIYSVALGKPSIPNWFKNGIPKGSLMEQLLLKSKLLATLNYNVQPAIASNGSYVFVLTARSLLKIGTGFNGTIKGFIYAANHEFGKDKRGWIGFCDSVLFYKKFSKRNNDSMLIVNTETLTIISASQISIPTNKDGQQPVLFSDGKSLNAICLTQDDTLVARQLYTTEEIIPDLLLKLARKSFQCFGYATFEEEMLSPNQIQTIQSTYNPFDPKLPNDLEVISISSGKDFGLVCASNGKIFYYGKSTSLGLKANEKSPTLNLTELIISKSVNIIQIAVGHDGIHAILVNDDGTVYFTGIARRGEDGDTSKNRRQPKAVKPKKLSKLDAHFIVNASCNNGTSAFVTKNGKLIMYGKDTAHCDSSGFVTDLLDQHITKVAMGKAHCVALNNKGQLFTFGLNNKGQCGRIKDQILASPIPADTQSIEEIAASNLDEPNSLNPFKLDASNMCEYDEHTIGHGQCRVCTVCRECTGYNSLCVSTQNKILECRIPGENCSCGNGESGCSKCGSCSTCISIQDPEHFHNSNKDSSFNQYVQERYKSVFNEQTDKKHVDEQQLCPANVDRETPRVAPLPPKRIQIPSSNPITQIACGLHHTVVLTIAGEVFTFGSNQYGQLGSGDLQPRTGPVLIKVPGFVNQIAAGSNHTVLLTHKGVVYTFGNQQKGQLGRLATDGPVNSMDDGVVKPSNGLDDVQINVQNIHLERQKFLWNCYPGAAFGIGLNVGKKATWISASGDQTFLKIDESLITGTMLNKVNVVADKNTIVFIPHIPLSFHCLTINRQDGNCIVHSINQEDFAQIIQSSSNTILQQASDKCNQNNIESNAVNNRTMSRSQDRMSQSAQSFDLNEQHPRGGKKRQEHRSDKIMPQLSFALDSIYGVLWVFDAIGKKLSYYNVIASEIPYKSDSYLRSILSPELALPQKSDIPITRSQASLNLLACIDILTSAQDSIPMCFEQELQPPSPPTRDTQLNEYQTVSRFDNFGGGWGYSGHSVEAIRFMVDTDILLFGFGIFGGRGEYTCKLKLFDLGNDGGGYEKDGILLTETDEIPYECPARSKYNVLLPKALTINSGKWYLVWAKISGPSSDCGSSGQSTVITEDQIVFSFKTSKKANNGTDVNSGQIPSILYRSITQESKPLMSVSTEPIYKISRLFANTVTKDCFNSLVILLRWSWDSFKLGLNDLKDNKPMPQTITMLNRLYYINKACLRLLRKYTNEIYPNYVSTEKSDKSRKSINSDPKDSEYPSASTSKSFPISNNKIGNGMDPATPTNLKKVNTENLQLAECIGDVRALLIHILCDTVVDGVQQEGYDLCVEILDECHSTFLSCYNAFYPTSSLKWNCLCDLLQQKDKGTLHARLLSAILAGLCNPSVRLRSTFSLLSSNCESKSIVSPSDNSGLPMLTSMESHQYPVLVEQMIYRTQKEKSDFICNTWTFKEVIARLLDIISYPIKSQIENIYNRSNTYPNNCHYFVNQKLIDNCCNLLARVLGEIVYQSCSYEADTPLLSSRSLQSTGTRFTRFDSSRTWNTGNFGPDAIAFSVDRPGIAIAGATVYSGSGSYEYQLELLYDTIESKSQHKWETLESISGSYDQDIVQNDMAEIKFDRPVYIKENTRYAIRLCSQGARTCSGDMGRVSVRGPCGATFLFYSCDLSFNGTTPARGQIPCLLYYSNPSKIESNTGRILNEIHARDTALQIATDITRKCSEMLILARNTLASNLSPSDKSPNSSNNTQTIDSEQNITPIEEHFDVNFANNTNRTTSSTPIGLQECNLSTARDITKRIESFSKGIMETLKFDKRMAGTNPFEFEIEIGATEIHPDDLLEQNGHVGGDYNWKNDSRISKLNGNDRVQSGGSEFKNNYNDIVKSSASDDEESLEMNVIQTLALFENRSASMFHTLLPLVFAHISSLAESDPKSSVHILNLIRELLPHVAALNQLTYSKDVILGKREDKLEGNQDLNTTSKHYCVMESDHPYKQASINTFCVEFPVCVQWMSIEFDIQSGTAQPEDNLHISIPSVPDKQNEHLFNSEIVSEFSVSIGDDPLYQAMKMDDKINSQYHGVNITSSLIRRGEGNETKYSFDETDWIVVKSFNTPSNWSPNALILPGNRLQLSLETASHYANDQLANKYGFKCLIVGYDNPILMNYSCTNLNRLECELAYLGGLCSANLMKRDIILPGDNITEDASIVDDILTQHSALLSKGLAISDSLLTINEVLEPYLPLGGQSNERQFLKDFVSAAPGSSGARLAVWLQPEPRLDPNRCELKPIEEPVRFGWPTQLIVITRDQYGDTVYVPDLTVEIRATPSVGTAATNARKCRQFQGGDPQPITKGYVMPPKIQYEPTIKEKMCFNAITFMKAYSQYSFEELRFCNPSQTRLAETMCAQYMDDLTLGAIWTPMSVGNFCLTITIDGVPLEEIYRIEVKEAGVPPPSQNKAMRKIQPPNKLRKFIAQNSAGLRIRSHPTLQSEQVGIVKMYGIVSFIDEIRNDDGIWVRLSTEFIRQHCTSGWYPSEAWCLQYNQHLEKTLLHPILESNENKATSNTRQSSTSSIIDIISGDNQIEIDPHPSTSTGKKRFNSTDSHPSGVGHFNTNPFLNSGQQQSIVESRKDITNIGRDLEQSDENSQENYDNFQTDQFSLTGEDDKSQSSGQFSNLPRSGNGSLNSSFNHSTNLGSAIAGVMGGGASKLLHKWFKGDGTSSFDGKELSRKKQELSEIASVSVRDWVKAIGGQENVCKTNGNECSSSNPVAILRGRQEPESAHSSSSKTGDGFDSPFQDLSPGKSTIKSGQNDEFKNYPPLYNQSNYPQKSRNKTFLKENFSKFPNENRKSIQKNVDLIQSIFQCPSDLDTDIPTSSSDYDHTYTKRALPSSLAECLRAVFASFLWHEGLVHDAMACASFLKFHPSLLKQSAMLVAGNSNVPTDSTVLTKEQRAQQRYSVEVANTGNYLNIRPSTLETLTKSGNSSIHNRRHRKNLSNTVYGDDRNNMWGDASENEFGKFPTAISDKVPICPPALRCLVYLWENLCHSCIQIVQSGSLNKITSEKNKPDDSDAKLFRNSRLKRRDDDCWCELCELFLPVPVTCHMRIVHPGCGKSAKGKGYNSVGMFCEGWAGNCGEGGKGASSWYLLCDTCREKYTSGRNKNKNNVNVKPADANIKIDNILGLKSAPINLSAYSVMKENAMFLLELSSTNIAPHIVQQRKSPQTMPFVSESKIYQIVADLNRPSTSHGESNNSSNRIGCKGNRGTGTNSQFHRRSDISNVNSDLMWTAPDTFACLDSLGVSMPKNDSYDLFGWNTSENGYERPLSKVSVDSFESTMHSGMFVDQIGGGKSNTGPTSRFHRSFSMGQGWPTQLNSATGRFSQQNYEPDQSRVVLRRRNNSICDPEYGSLLLCHPSENLRKLVPDSVYNWSASKLIGNKIDGSATNNESSSTFSQDDKTTSSLKTGVVESLRNTDEICLWSRPVMLFVLQTHNLEKLRLSLKRNLRIATCRIYSLQALNWLIRSVTQTICLHDLMWWFVLSLKPDHDESVKDDSDQGLEHPITSIQLCGKISILLAQSFHSYLQSVADITLLLPGGTALQQIAIQCFGIKFRQADHQFLHRSHVFGNISKILSKSDEQNDELGVTMQESGVHPMSQSELMLGTKISSLVDLAGLFELSVSSRPAMANSLIDNSTETFWESDDEDRSKSKIIEISLIKNTHFCKMISIHIDNSRDVQNKVSNVTVYTGQSLNDVKFFKSVDVPQKCGSWVSIKITNNDWTHFRLEFTGPENTLRVRQIKLLGIAAVGFGQPDEQRINAKLTNYQLIQQRNCESETLRVFRLITSQVFGKLILGSDRANNLGSDPVANPQSTEIDNGSSSLLAESLDLREHMVGILFSRSKLSHLQKQVIVHIVNAIRKETQKAKEEWETLNSIRGGYGESGNCDEKSESSSEYSRAPDTYCFEMLSMVLALSGSSVGRSYLSHQHVLLRDLFSLLHTGSDRVQRQVTALLRRILPEITPEHLADLLGIQKMPPNDFNIVHQASDPFNMNQLGILDIFLAVIAKSLQLQIKIKATTLNKNAQTVKLCNCINFDVGNSMTSIEHDDKSNENNNSQLVTDFKLAKRNLESARNQLNQRWFLKGMISSKQAENIISLIRDMTSGKFTDKWSIVTKAAIAEAILNLTRLDDIYRSHENCIKTSTLWLALASLCVLDKDHVEKLSSGQWAKTTESRPLCTNHDDGITPAIIQCEICSSLCGDCDRYLHLNRKTRAHNRTVCKEEEEAIRVELHESCGRTKLFWLLALADSRTLKAMVEFRDGNNAIIGLGGLAANSIGRCRFCGMTGNSGLLAIGNVCADAQCQEHAVNACTRTKSCGHSCGGVVNETKCLPCLQLMCHNDKKEKDTEIDDGNGPKLTQDADDMCMICFVEALSCAPAIQLDCGHIFHYHCCRMVLERRWNGPRISFGFSQCPICKINIQHPVLANMLAEINALRDDVKRKAIMRLEYEGVMKTIDHKDIATYAMDRYAYYVCFKCNKAYYGGEARCDAEIGDKFNPQELVCGGCSDVARAQMCPKHGTDYLEYKCRYCCSVAVFFCFGTTHFCDTCHDDFQRLTNIPKNKLPRCPAGPKAKQLLGDECPLHIVHPPTGEEFALGCGVCRHYQTF